jgi:hypothetical protein
MGWFGCIWVEFGEYRAGLHSLIKSLVKMFHAEKSLKARLCG